MAEDYALNATKNKKDVREIEQFYVNGKLDNIHSIIEKKKQDIIIDIENYVAKNSRIQHDKAGNPISVVNQNPILIQNYFFKTLNPLANKIPQYSAENLGLVWYLYDYLVGEVNANIGEFNHTMTGFCRFAGITTGTINHYKNSGDEDMQIVIEKIVDACYDVNMTMAQHGRVRERSTIVRMGAELNKHEKQGPTIINNTLNVNSEDILKRLNERSEWLQSNDNKKR